jgi:hypothetical protein
MFLFDEILLSHALDRIVFLVFFVLAQHNLAERTSTEHFKQFELLEVSNVVAVCLALENNFTLGFNLVALFDAFGIEHEGFYGVELLDVFADIVDGGGK